MTNGLIASSESKVVFGLGATGLSCARFLHARAQAFCVVDTRSEPPGLDTLRELMPEVAVYAGDIPHGVLEAATELIVSPGISLDEEHVVRAREAGAAILGDIDLFVREARAPVVGITGSNAKSTVTELLGQMARAAGLNAGVGGNLGTPALELLDSARELYVLELSSFQLERAATLNLAVATVLNLSADHLDRHGSMPRYHQAKHRIFRGCQKAVVHRDDSLTIPLLPGDVPLIGWRLGEPDLQDFGLRTIDGQETICHGFEPWMAAAELGCRGRHNLANALAALALGESVGLPREAMLDTLRTFRGLPHRCQRVATAGGVHYINDSKATNVGATLAALEGLGGQNNVWLLAGGQSKGADLGPLRAAVQRYCREVLVMGEARDSLLEVLADTVPLRSVADVSEAVQIAAAAASAGDIVLLSPACASFDQYSGYAARGDAFATAVNHVVEESA